GRVHREGAVQAGGLIGRRRVCLPWEGALPAARRSRESDLFAVAVMQRGRPNLRPSRSLQTELRRRWLEARATRQRLRSSVFAKLPPNATTARDACDLLRQRRHEPSKGLPGSPRAALPTLSCRWTATTPPQ